MERFECSGKERYDVNPRLLFGVGGRRLSEEMRTNPSQEAQKYVEFVISMKDRHLDMWYENENYKLIRNVKKIYPKIILRDNSNYEA
jgi:hypothetical protein